MASRAEAAHSEGNDLAPRVPSGWEDSPADLALSLGVTLFSPVEALHHFCQDVKPHPTGVRRPTALARVLRQHAGIFLAPPEGLGSEATEALRLISCAGSVSSGVR